MRTDYSQQQYEGLLLWCIGMLLDDLEKVVDTFPNHKPLSELDEKEFVIENADMSLGIVEGQLVSMGIDPQKLIKEVIHNFKLESEDIFCSIEIEDKNEYR
jgi:hypothetical protein